MKIRRIEATFHHTESNRFEVRTVTVWLPNHYVITKAYVFEDERWLCFDTETNEFLVPD